MNFIIKKKKSNYLAHFLEVYLLEEHTLIHLLCMFCLVLSHLLYDLKKVDLRFWQKFKHLNKKSPDLSPVKALPVSCATMRSRSQTYD